MTTIILTIIGILLAAAAALMVIFYGGDAFNSGSIGAKANTLQNAGTNVESAATLYKVENASAATSIGDLLAVGPNGGKYLKESPALTGVGTLPAIAGNYFTVSTVAADVCAKVNKNLSNAAADTAATGIFPGKMGCNATDKIFYAAL